MVDLFDVPWSQLELAQVRAFLEEADEEGVTWEAKADDDDRGRLRPDSIRKAACGLANQIGGYVIIGARRDDNGRWLLPGTARPEPKLWVSEVLQGLQPLPRFESKAWKVDDGRVLLVVRIEPVAAPPCMTPQGRVYERVSGQTLPVENPALLERLFRRGEHARARAEHFARRAALRALDAPQWHHQCAAGVSVALAPVAQETDGISSRLFLGSTRKCIKESVWRLLGDSQPADIEQRHQQDAYTMLGHIYELLIPDSGESMRRSPVCTWLAQATWDGAVAAGVTLSKRAVEDSRPPEEIVRSCWQEVAPLVELLGGYGPGHLTLIVHASQPEREQVGGQVATAPPPTPPKGSLYARLPETRTYLNRVINVAPPDEEALASLQRELNRAAGKPDDEPEPEAPPSPESE